ncbi:MAG: BrnA antitoxin family protein [Hyphomicrobiaceae bacterium]|nr:BrnA antitoxin family protein [Hyphomicrobiaceae bacterium]
MASEKKKPDPFLVDAETAPLTDEETGRLRPATDVFRELGLPAPRPVGRPKADNPKERISLRVSPQTLAAFKATGKGWQTRMDEVLTRAVKNGKVGG